MHRSWKKSLAQPAILLWALGGICVLVLLASLLLQREQQQRATSDFHWLAELQQQQIAAHLDGGLQLLQAVGTLASAGGKTSYASTQAHAHALEISHAAHGLRSLDFQPYRSDARALPDPAHHAALQQAIEEGRPIALAGAHGGQAPQHDEDAGFIVYLPVYQRGMPTHNPTQRREALTGYVLGTWSFALLTHRNAGQQARDMALQVYQPSPQGPQLLWQAPPPPAYAHQPRFQVDLPLAFADQHWTVRYQDLPSYTPHLEGGIYRWILLAAGLSLLILMLMAVRVHLHYRAELEKSAADLQTNHDQFSALLSNIPGTVFRAQPQSPWHITFMSGTHEITTGHPVELYISKALSYSAQTHPADIPTIEKISNDAIAGHRGYVIEYRVKHCSGAWRWARMHACAVYGDNGVPHFVDGVIFDITAEKLARQELQELTNHLPVVVYRYRLEEGDKPHLLYISEGVQRLTGMAATDVMADPLLLFSKIHPEDAPHFIAADKEAWHQRKDFSEEVRFYMPSGALRWLYINASPFEFADGSIAYHGFVEDITERKLSEVRIQKSESFLQQIFNTSNVAIFLVDKEGIITVANQSMAAMFRCPLEELVGSPYVAHIDAAERLVGQQKMLALLNSDIHEVDLERLYWRDDGSTFWGNLSGKRFHDIHGIDRGLLGVIMDITQRKQAEEEIRNLAFYDPLTGLPNRRLLIDRLEHCLAASARSGIYGAIIFIDLDNFKTLNDTLGHGTGDQLLVAVAQRLQACVREEDTIARLGGDEFIVILSSLHTSAIEAAALAEVVGHKIIQALNPPYQIHQHFLRSTPSLGITLFHGHHASIDEMLKHADLAMYEAKAAGRNTLRFFDPKMQAEINARAQMEGELYRAIENQEFCLHYQPQMNAQGKVIGVECLLRWYKPESGMVSPAQFIPIAEETGQILAIGHWVLQEACRQQAQWQQHSTTQDLEIAINVSAKQFHASNFVQDLAQIIQNTGANPARLQLELTESLLIHDMDDAITKMHHLRALGVSFSLDDFGTGYSSLSYLKRLPLCQLKIDQSFVRDILSDPNDRAICRAVIALAKNMGLRVIAEGVETEAQWQLLRTDDCEEGQGYLFSRPLPAAEIERWLHQAAHSSARP